MKLSHIAIACPQIQAVAERLKKLSLKIEKTHDVPTERVRAAMIPVEVSDEFRIELLEPTTPDSPIAKFLSKRTEGGLHHVSFEVDDIRKWHELLKKESIEVIAPGIRKAARGEALFIHPKQMGGVLVELEQISAHN